VIVFEGHKTSLLLLTGIHYKNKINWNNERKVKNSHFLPKML